MPEVVAGNAAFLWSTGVDFVEGLDPGDVRVFSWCTFSGTLGVVGLREDVVKAAQGEERG